MKKLFQLVFGDARNVACVLAALALAGAVARVLPSAAGWVLIAALFAGAAWQAGL